VTYKILVVDDESSVRDSVATLLRDVGYTVLTFGDVPSALRALEENDPDLLITDVRIDGYNGLQLIAMAPKPIRALVVTGFADPAIEADARRLGADYLVKPVPFETLHAHVAAMLFQAPPHTAFISTRIAPRRRLAQSQSVRVDDSQGRIIDVSANGARLEIQSKDPIEAGTTCVLDVEGAEARIPTTVIWKRRQDSETWMCGVAIAPERQDDWRRLFPSISN
jgi:DNA-binding response OmpR family regulator